MTYFRKASSWKYPANAARTHARACRRVMATAASCSRPRSLTTFAVSSSSAIVSTTARMNARRRFGGIERMNACPQIIMIVSSADGSGISPAIDGGNAIRSGILTPHNAAPRCHVVSGRDKTGICKAGLAHGQGCPQDVSLRITRVYRPRYTNQRPIVVPTAGAVGPGWTPPAGRGRPLREKTGVSSPGPLHQFLNHCGLPSPLPCKAGERSAQIREVDGRAFVALRRLQKVPRRDLRLPSKARIDHVAHVVRSKSPPALGASPR